MSVLSNVKHRLHVCAAWEYPWLRVLLSINNTRGGGECGVVRCSGSRPSPTTTIQQQQQWQLLSPGKAPCFSAQCSTFVKRKMTIYQSAVYSTCHLLRKYKSETKRFGNLIDQIQLFTTTLIIIFEVHWIIIFVSNIYIFTYPLHIISRQTCSGICNLIQIEDLVCVNYTHGWETEASNIHWSQMYRSWYSNTVLFFIKNNVGLLGYFFQLTKRREECAEECIKCININRWREYYFLAIQPVPCNASVRSVWSPCLVILVMFCHTFGVSPCYICGHLVIYINVVTFLILILSSSMWSPFF